MDSVSDFQEMKNLFIKLGIEFAELTSEVDSTMSPRHIAIYINDFIFVFDKKSGIFFDTRNRRID